jgi:hypothetical protein
MVTTPSPSDLSRKCSMLCGLSLRPSISTISNIYRPYALISAAISVTMASSPNHDH